jgi:signal peptidase I
MSPYSSDNGDSPAVTDGHLDRPLSSSSNGSGRHRHDTAAHRAAAVRSPQELDYRLRGLGTEPAEHVTATPPRTEHRPRRHGPLLAKAAALFAVAVLAAVLLQAYVVKPFTVPGNAMAPALQAGDRILVVKSGLLEGPIRSGQIVVFHSPRFLPCRVVGGRGGDLVLRVVALPGETIWSVDNTIFVDGRPLRERGWYDPHFGQLGSTPIASTTLARGQYFVLADNRSDACDSRVFGPIPKSSIVGRGIAIVGRHGHVYFAGL